MIGIRKSAILVVCTAALLSSMLVRGQGPHEIYRTEYGSEYSDGSSTIDGDSATFTPDNGSMILQIDSSRPVDRAADRLQSRYGYVITYEDPPYTNEDDLQDVAARVRKDYSSYPSGWAPKLMVPKGGKLTLRLPVSMDISSEDLAAILQQVVVAQASSHRGGRFRVKRAGEVFHLIPTEVRDHRGIWSYDNSLLDTRISLPEQDRSETELYEAIAHAVSEARGVKLWVIVNGGIIMGMRPPEIHASMGAALEPAREVLMRAVKLHPTPRTWALVHQPERGISNFALAVRDFPVRPREPPAPPLPCADNAVELGPCDASEKPMVPCSNAADVTIDWLQLPCTPRSPPSWARPGRRGTSALLEVSGTGLDGGYAEFTSTQPVNGRATEDQVCEAMVKATEYCRAFDRHVIVLGEAADRSGRSPALVFRCDRRSSALDK